MHADSIQIRKAETRGQASYGWLETNYSFSFADYYDPQRKNFSVLRVLNDDVIAPNAGFDPHPHRDMEIITYMLAGALEHQDSMGNRHTIRAGQVQVMSAGSGVVHSEHNASADEATHLLQIWLYPKQNGLTPSYSDRHFSEAEKSQRWCLIASPDGQANSLLIHQDVYLWATVLEKSALIGFTQNPGRMLYLHVASGELQVNGMELRGGDAMAIQDTSQTLSLLASQKSEVLLFDLPVL